MGPLCPACRGFEYLACLLFGILFLHFAEVQHARFCNKLRDLPDAVQCSGAAQRNRSLLPAAKVSSGSDGLQLGRKWRASRIREKLQGRKQVTESEEACRLAQAT